MFSLRIITTDYRMEVPLPGFDVTFSEFRSRSVHKVPIVRIFGTTTLGQKACLNLHGIFPYLYVTLDSDISPSDLQLHQFAMSLDKALNVALGRSSSTSQHVYKVVAVSGIPYYGYHAKECLFLKIFLYSPFMIKKAADLLLAGAIMNRTFQPHESHIPYILQMFMDYNLFGMNFIHLSGVKFRLPVPSSNNGLQWNSDSVMSSMMSPEKRSTRCELEVDGLACDILNREELSDRMVGNPGLLALWHEERMRCKRNGINYQLTPPLTPERYPQEVAAEESLRFKFHEILKSFKFGLQSKGGDDIIKSRDAFNDSESDAIICERTILDVVNKSEHFLEESIPKISSQPFDLSFANLLAFMAFDEGSSQRHRKGSEMEDWDSVLSQNPTRKNVMMMITGRKDINEDEEDNDDVISLEMSQCFDPDPKEQDHLTLCGSKKRKLSPDVQAEIKYLKARKSLSPIKARKLMRMKSQLLRRKYQTWKVLGERNYLNEATEFSSIKNMNHKLPQMRLRSSKVLVTDRIFVDDVRRTINSVEDAYQDAQGHKLFSDLIRKLKDDADESTEFVSQHGALESLAFLSSPDSFISPGTPPDPNLTNVEDFKRSSEVHCSSCNENNCKNFYETGGSFIDFDYKKLDLAFSLEETTLVKEKVQNKVLNEYSLNISKIDVHRGFELKENISHGRSVQRRQLLKGGEPRQSVIGYSKVERDIVSGRLDGPCAGGSDTLRNAEKILEKKMVLSRKIERLYLYPGFVEDLLEHDGSEFPCGLNDLKCILKCREETQFTSIRKTNKSRTKHILASFLNGEHLVYIVPHTSPPSHDSIKKSLEGIKEETQISIEEQAMVPQLVANGFSLGSKHKKDEITLKRNANNLTVSFNLQNNEFLDAFSPQTNVNDECDSALGQRIYSSTPFHDPQALPTQLDITPISQTPNGGLLKTGHDDSRQSRKEDLKYEDVQLKQSMKKVVPLDINKKLKASESEIEAATPTNMFNFKVDSQNLQQLKNLSENQYLCIISLELHISTRGQLNPDPEYDVIMAAFYHISDERPVPSQNLKNDGTASKNFEPSNECSKEENVISGVFLLLDRCERSSLVLQDVQANFCSSELELIMGVVELVKRYDADILVGYEIQKLSWGYLIHRAASLNIYLPAKLSRFEESNEEPKRNNHKETSDILNEDLLFSSDVVVPGRIVLNLWRILRHEVTLNIYTYENVSFHVLHQRVPHFSFQSLTSWFSHKSCLHRWKTLEYYILRCRGNLQILQQLDLVGQTSEFARIYGIEFFDVLNRGSQYRVESMMLRLAKPQNFIAVSPSVQQRAAMKSPECIPLNLEPRSDFYTDPIVVLDFQSLYPSIMIAYNYCFSTCLGRMQHFSKARDGPFEFGCTSLHVPGDLLEALKDDVNICSNGVVFVKSNIRKGILPSMVEEILNTRLMVKKAMKVHKDEKGLQRLLHARQLGLKLIANVTFGYTAANFSGRMACVEVGDSIMRKARDTLEAAISLVEKTVRWGAEVVYGDTDSMFVLLRGRSKDQAFKIGQEIAEAVTKSNPKPVKLKLEKVYLPCILQTKKRYVGFMYESADQKEPIFDAKGIETVRRDNCPAVSKILEKSIKILFTTCELNLVKDYVQKQCIKILDGQTSLQDFIFAKEYRGMKSYHPTACIPALKIAKERLIKDRQSEPLTGERVPYIIVRGTSSQPLIELVREPHELMDDSSLRINSSYYLIKQILPTINRFTMLFRVNALHWLIDLPRTLKMNSKLFGPVNADDPDPNRCIFNQYLSCGECHICGEICNSDMCNDCEDDKQKRLLFIYAKIRKNQSKLHEAQQICGACRRWQERDNSCTSYDCPIFFQQLKAKKNLAETQALMRFQNF